MKLLIHTKRQDEENETTKGWEYGRMRIKMLIKVNKTKRKKEEKEMGYWNNLIS